MESRDLDLLCAALAFTAVAMKGENMMPDAERATGLAYLIKEFCLATVPDAFPEEQEIGTRGVGAGLSPEGKFGIADRMATIIAKLMRENDECQPQDLIAEGFAPVEIERHWTMARALAQVELNMMDS